MKRKWIEKEVREPKPKAAEGEEAESYAESSEDEYYRP